MSTAPGRRVRARRNACSRRNRARRCVSCGSNNRRRNQRCRRICMGSKNKKGNRKTVDGGRTIMQELEYAENGTYKRYAGYDVLNISPSVIMSAAQYSIAQAAVAVSINGLEEIQNAGVEKMIDLLESRIGNAERTLRNNIALDVYSDGTADGGRQIGGLHHRARQSRRRHGGRHQRQFGVDLAGHHPSAVNIVQPAHHPVGQQQFLDLVAHTSNGNI